ncbi:hypothetical protein V1290_007398 [Bradyrhizobium sp. AZCC 1578]|uniref:hypothetical protein n=1 Tax=Bradyrhizobium sp. AZCC 1578 TaxID=3117027 RepID=UPI002FF3F557
MANLDPFASKLRLFLSVDIVGSTAFKQAGKRRAKEEADDSQTPPAEPWFSPIAQFYKGMEQAVAREWMIAEARSNQIKWPPGDSPELWKSVGDEVIYTKLLSDHRQALTTLNAWIKAVAHYRVRLKQQFPSLDLKSTAWIAGFPVHNAEVFFRTSASPAKLEDDEGDEVYSNLSLLHEYYTNESSAGLTRDFIGPAIDTGFRLAQLSSPRRLVVSVELALMLIHAVRTQPSDEHYDYEKPRFFFHGRHSFKGVFGGLPYPVFWIDMRPSPDLERTEDKLNRAEPLGTDDVLEFCEAFIKDNSSYCFMPYISGNLEPAFARVPEHHKERLDGLRNYWESERTKREVERESLSQKEDDAGAAGTSPAAEELEAWLAEHLTKHEGKTTGEDG